MESKRKKKKKKKKKTYKHNLIISTQTRVPNNAENHQPN